jgi:hypothetical protein
MNEMTEPYWRKSTRSMADGQCVEVATVGVSWVWS